MAPSGGEVRIVDAAALSAAVETLGVGLKSFGDNTGQMETICNSFQGRLGQLEAEMRPMKMMSQKLSVARRHVVEAVEEMEKVNEYFTLEAEKREALARGVRGATPARLAEYADDVRRVLEAVAFFRTLPSLRSQGTALAGLSALCATAASECLDEYGRLMRAVAPSVQYNAATGVYDPVAPLSEAAAAGLAAVQGSLELLDKRAALRQAYASARRITVAATLRGWSEKFEPALAVAGRGGAAAAAGAQDKAMGGARLSAYLDFAVKLVAGERLLWEQALGVNPLRHRERAAEEVFLAVVSSVIEKLVHDVDAGVQDALGELKAAQGDAGGGMAAKARDKLDKAKGQSTMEGDRRVEAMVLLMEVGDTLNRGTALMLRVLRLGGPEDDNALTNALLGVQAKLCLTALQSCLDLVDAVQHDPCSKRNVPENAAVHVLTSNTLRAIKRIMPFREGYEVIASAARQRVPWDGELDASVPQRRGSLPRDAQVPVDAENSDEARACPHFTAFANHLLRQLLDNLVEKSKVYPVPNSVLSGSSVRADAIATIFKPDSPRSAAASAMSRGGGDGVLSPRSLRRNIAVDTFFSGSSRKGAEDEPAPLSVAHFLSAATQGILERLIREKVTTYCATLFDPLADAVADDVGQLEYAGRGSRLLTLECGRLIKTKFSTFNEAWDELHSSQKGLNVGDADIRELLMEEARDRVLAPYRQLYDTYREVQFSKKHQGEYLKYSPDMVDRGIQELFQG